MYTARTNNTVATDGKNIGGRVAKFLVQQMYQNGKNGKNIWPQFKKNRDKIYQMATKYSNTLHSKAIK
jgi:hypothetical protein